MKKLLTGLFIFALAINLLFIAGASPVHGQGNGQGNGQDGEVTEQNCDVNNDGEVDETEAADCETNGQAGNDNRGHGNDADGCDADNPGNGDQCPTEEPTDQPANAPADEPTDEPAAEPTDEPADTPTDESADAPTDEPADTPTDEPAAEPTDESADEPAAEPTDESADAPADEPAAEPTDESADAPVDEEVPADAGTPDQAMPDEGKTDETVVDDGTGTGAETPTVIESQEGEIGDSAVVGTWNTELITVQNLGTGSATVGLQLYDANGNTVGAPLDPGAIPVGGGVQIDTSSVSAGRYSGKVTASENVAVAVLTQNTTYGTSDLYLGISNPAQKVIIPLIYRNHFGWTSKFHIQNAHTSAQNITVKTYLIQTNVPAVELPSGGVPYNNVAANASFTVDFANDSAYNAFGSGNNFYGYAIVTGASGPVAVVGNNIRDDGVADKMETFSSGLANDPGNSDAGRDYIAPVVFKSWFTWETAINLVNPGSTAGTVDVTYNSSDANGNSYSDASTVNIAAGSVATYYPPRDGTVGLAILSSSNIDFVTLVNSNKTPFQGIGTAIPALNKNQATTKVAIPLMYNTSSWDSAVNVAAVTCGNVTAKWLPLGADPTTNTKTNAAFTLCPTDPPKTLYGTGAEGLASGQTGVLFLESTGTLMAQGNYNNPPAAGGFLAAGLPGKSY